MYRGFTSLMIHVICVRQTWEAWILWFNTLISLDSGEKQQLTNMAPMVETIQDLRGLAAYRAWSWFSPACELHAVSKLPQLHTWLSSHSTLHKGISSYDSGSGGSCHELVQLVCPLPWPPLSTIFFEEPGWGAFCRLSAKSPECLCLCTGCFGARRTRILHVPFTYLRHNIIGVLHWASTLRVAWIHKHNVYMHSLSPSCHCAYPWFLLKKSRWRSPLRKRISKAWRESRKKWRNSKRKPKSKLSRKKSASDLLQVAIKPVSTTGMHSCPARWSIHWHSA